MNGSLTCIFCASPLTADNSADEHVIPNSIGGRLVTKNATCRQCNSTIGASVEADLLSSLAFLATALDVPRDRGTNQTLVTKDEESGLDLQISPGCSPILAPNIKIQQTPEGRVVELNAPSVEEAERVFKKLVLSGKRRKRKQLKVNKVETSPREPQKFKFGHTLFEFTNERHLQAIAKIALCFARERGLALTSSCIAARFMRGESVNVVPVAPLADDIVAFEPTPVLPLSHGVYLLKAPGSRLLFGYVVLFESVEAVVLLDDASDLQNVATGYRYDLTHALPERRSFFWKARPEDLGANFQRRVVLAERFKSRWVNVEHWLRNRQALWLRRAKGAGLVAYHAAISSGRPETEAESNAIAQVKSIAAKYGLRIEGVGIRKEAAGPSPGPSS